MVEKVTKQVIDQRIKYLRRGRLNERCWYSQGESNPCWRSHLRVRSGLRFDILCWYSQRESNSRLHRERVSS